MTRLKISIVPAVLFLFSLFPANLQPLPLTETLYTIPEGQMELTLQEEISRLDKNFRMDQAGIGFGILPNLSLWLSSQVLHEWRGDGGRNSMGDTFIKIFSYIHGFREESVHAGFMLKIRVPTGEDTYSSGRWRDISFGNNEIKTGPVIQWRIRERFFINFNLFYLFRQAENEDFYGSFRFNLRSRETYSKTFGLNPLSDKTFLEWKRLENDYLFISVSMNTDRLYPLIPFLELQWKRRISSAGIPAHEAGPAPFGATPLLGSLGFRWFLTGAGYAGLHAVVPFLDPGTGGNFTAGMEAGIQF